MVPWERLSGEVVESICAAFICRQHRNATRIRPSQGDGGIDVVDKNWDGSYTVWQIKRFSTNLGSSEKNQIKDSWNRVLETMEKDKKTLKEWHLVMPLDPTPENKTWFHGLVEGSGVNAVWDGLSRVDGWAASMPEVIDYYLHDGYERIMEMVQEQLSAIGAEPLVDSDGLHRRLDALCKILDRQDPHYSYSISRLSEDDSRGRMLCNQPRLVMTGLWENGSGQCYRIDVFARYAAASQFAPIQGTMTLSPKDDQQRQQVSDFIDYGIPFKGIPGTLHETNGPSFVMPDESIQEGSFSIFLEEEPLGEVPALLLMTDDNTELRLYRKARSSGLKGFWVSLADKSEMIKCSLRATSGGEVNWELSFMFSHGIGKSCEAVLPCLEFIRAANECGGFSIICGNTNLLTSDKRFNSFGDKTLENVMELVGALLAIGRKTGRDVLMPDLVSLPDYEWTLALFAGALLSHGAARRRVGSLRFVSELQDLTTVDGLTALRWVDQFAIEFNGASYVIGPVEIFYPVQRAERGSREGEYVLYPPKDVEYLVAFIPESIPIATQYVGLFWIGPYDPDVWQSWIEEIECK